MEQGDARRPGSIGSRLLVGAQAWRWFRREPVLGERVALDLLLVLVQPAVLGELREVRGRGAEIPDLGKRTIRVHGEVRQDARRDRVRPLLSELPGVEFRIQRLAGKRNPALESRPARGPRQALRHGQVALPLQPLQRRERDAAERFLQRVHRHAAVFGDELQDAPIPGVDGEQGRDFDGRDHRHRLLPVSRGEAACHAVPEWRQVLRAHPAGELDVRPVQDRLGVGHGGDGPDGFECGLIGNLQHDALEDPLPEWHEHSLPGCGPDAIGHAIGERRTCRLCGVHGHLREAGARGWHRRRVVSRQQGERHVPILRARPVSVAASGCRGGGTPAGAPRRRDARDGKASALR